MEVDELFDQHAPKTLNDCLGAFIAKQELRKFLDGNHNLQEKNTLFIFGSPGSGKTTLCTLAFGNTDFTVLRPNYDHFAKHAEFETAINNFLTTRTLLEMLNKRPKIVFLDDFDVLVSQNRYAQSYLLDMMQKHNTVRFVLTSSEEKRFADWKKRTHVACIKITPPTTGEILTFVMNVLDQGGYEADAEDLLGIIKENGHNIRNIRNALITQPDEHIETQQHKLYQDLELFPLVSNIFNRYREGLHDLEIAISTDPTVCAYFLQENFMNWIVTRCSGEKMNAHEVYKEFSQINNTFGIITSYEPETPELLDLVRAYNVRCAQIKCAPSALNSNMTTLSFPKALSNVTQGRKIAQVAALQGLSQKHLCCMAELGLDVPDEMTSYQTVFCGGSKSKSKTSKTSKASKATTAKTTQKATKPKKTKELELELELEQEQKTNTKQKRVPKKLKDTTT